MNKTTKIFMCLLALSTLGSCSKKEHKIEPNTDEPLFQVTHFKQAGAFCTNVSRENTTKVLFKIESNFEYKLNRIKLIDWQVGKIDYKNLTKAKDMTYGWYSFELIIPNSVSQLSVKIQEMEYTKLETKTNHVYSNFNVILNLTGQYCAVDDSEPQETIYDDYIKNYRLQHISSKDLFNQKDHRYSVFFYASNQKECFDLSLKTAIFKKISVQKESIYFVNTNDYRDPGHAVDSKNIVSTAKEAKSCLYAKSLEEFKFFGFPSLYTFENDLHSGGDSKTITNISIGLAEVVNFLTVN